jgi:hypothetical protein
LTDANAFAHQPGVSFAIANIEHKADVLSVPFAAFCWYRYTVGSDPVTLHGKKRPDGMFEPVVKYEVATEGKVKWKRLSVDNEQSVTDTIIVSPDNPVTKLWVNMEPFQKAIGIFRYGRLILENGDAAIFEIEDLLPTADARGEANDYKEDVFQPDDEKRKEGTASSVISSLKLSRKVSDSRERGHWMEIFGPTPRSRLRTPTAIGRQSENHRTTEGPRRLRYQVERRKAFESY